MIKSCSCAHEYQDKMYGKQRRIHNATTRQGKDKGRCTVCKKEN